jgi:ABC-type uncharacterized transport system auxiliary subunit
MRARRIWALACLWIPAACASGTVAPDRYYRLEVAAPEVAQAAPRLPGSLRVMPFRADGLVRGTALLHSDVGHPSEVGRYATHHWVDSPTQMLQLETARFLRAARVADTVLPVDTSTRADWLVSGRVLRIERVEGAGAPRALLELELQVAQGPGRELVFQRGYREERPAGPDVRDAAAAMNAALGAILQRFVADLETAGSGVTPTPSAV